MVKAKPPRVLMIPGPDGAAEVTAVIPAVPAGRPPERALIQALLTDSSGRVLYAGWVPPGTRLVMRGMRVFTHYQANEWRQVPVVELGVDGRPV